MKKRILALSLASALVVGAMASCTAEKTAVSSEPVEKKDVTLVMWGAQDDQDFLKSVTDKFCKEYDKANVTVELKVMGEDVAKDEALKDVDSAGDVFGVALDQIGALADARAIYEIPDAATSQFENIDMSLGKYNGKYYGIPYIAECSSVLFYNKSLLSEEDVVSVEKILEKDCGSVKNFAPRFGSSWEDITWLATTGAKAFTDGDRTICDWNNADCVEIFKYIGTLKGTGKVANIDSKEVSTLVNAFKDKQIASSFIGTYAASDIKEALGDDYGVAKMPTLKDKQMVTFASGKVYVINAKCEDPDTALALIQYVSNEENQLKRFEERKALPTNSNLATNETILSDPTAAAELAQFAHTVPNGPIYGTVDYWNTINALVESAFNGEIPEDQVQTKLDELVKAYKGE